MNPLVNLPNQLEVRDHSLAHALTYDQLSFESALDLLAALAFSGVRRLEIPNVRQVEPDCAATPAQYIVSQLHNWPDVHFAVVVKSSDGATRALERGITDVIYVLDASASEPDMRNIRDITTSAHSAGGRCEIRIANAWDSPDDGPTDPLTVLRLVSDGAEADVDSFCLDDTTGAASPVRVAHLVDMIRGLHPDVNLFLRVRNTRGMAMANVLTGLQCRVTGVDASVGGLPAYHIDGVPQPSAAIEEIAYMCSEMDTDTGIDLDGLLAAAFWTRDALDRELPGELMQVDELRSGRDAVVLRLRSVGRSTTPTTNRAAQ